ncbi:hypothetical protein [Actinoplanes nipponensis]|uniref:hypothetical protein n=1 Tax=Actinoplanes nipponensis TaxID=135950 RepID=UPI0031ECFEB3
MPADEEHVHQRDDDRREREDLEDDLPADRAEQPGRPAHRDHRGVAADRVAQPFEGLGAAVQLLALQGLDQHEQRRAQQPPGQTGALAAQQEPQQPARAGHDATFSPAARSSP